MADMQTWEDVLAHFDEFKHVDIQRAEADGIYWCRECYNIKAGEMGFNPTPRVVFPEETVREAERVWAVTRDTNHIITEDGP